MHSFMNKYARLGSDMNEARKIRALVVDDEPLARRRILKMLARDGEVETVGECADGYEALAAVEEQAPDLVR